MQNSFAIRVFLFSSLMWHPARLSGEKRWEKVLSLLKQGDVVLIQMGHNDEKEKGEGVGAFTTFQTDLKRFVTDAKMKGATPVVITPMERRGFDGNKARISHGNYPEAVRRLAKEEHVARCIANYLDRGVPFCISINP